MTAIILITEKETILPADLSDLDHGMVVDCLFRVKGRPGNPLDLAHFSLAVG
jgi:hypothetical protein